MKSEDEQVHMNLCLVRKAEMRHAQDVKMQLKQMEGEERRKILAQEKEMQR
jgi:hypothetical protein